MSIASHSTAHWNPSAANRAQFAQSFGASLDIEPGTSAQAVVRDADVVLCATRSRDESPVLQGHWLSAGTTVVSLGSTLPEQREVDVETMARAACIVADMPKEVAEDTGDAIAAQQAGVPVTEKLVSLADLVAQRIAPRRASDDIVLYKSVGSALQDVVLAEMLLARAKSRGIGIELPAFIHPVAK